MRRWFIANHIRDSGLSCICLPNSHTSAEHPLHLKPELILLDAGDDNEFFRDLRRYDDITIPMIHLVAADAPSRSRAFSSGAVDCIVKPVVKEELIARLRAQLELRGNARATRSQGYAV